MLNPHQKDKKTKAPFVPVLLMIWDHGHFVLTTLDDQLKWPKTFAQYNNNQQRKAI